MFSNVGWGEILVLLVVILIFIGPERLPGLIREIRAVLLAIRNAVGQAREQLDDEFGDEMKSLAQPLSELNNVRKMGPRGFITKTLLDGDDSFLTPLDEAKETAQSIQRGSLRDFARGGAGVPHEDGKGRDVELPTDTPAQPESEKPQPAQPNWDDVT